MIDPRNQPVIVAHDVKDGAGADLIGLSENHSKLDEIPPNGDSGDSGPSKQRSGGLRMPSGVLA